MKRSEYHRLIDRYLEGEMRYSERESFEMTAARDADLGRMLETEKIIRRTLDGDRGMIRAEHTRLRSHLAAFLGTVPVNFTLPGAAGSGAVSAGIFKSAVSVISALGVVVLSLVVLLPSDPENRMAPASSPDPKTEVPDAPLLPDAGDEPVEYRDIDSSPGFPLTGAKNPSGAQGATPADEEAAPEIEPGVTSSTPGASVLTSDTVRMRLNIDLKKLRDKSPR